MALVVTPAGRVLRRSVEPDAAPEVFAAQFSLSHLAWLVTYPIAGWLGTSAGFTTTWSILLAVTVVGSVAALMLWPAEPDPDSRTVEAHAKSPFGDTLSNDEAQSAAWTLAACQCRCARPI